MNVRRWYLYNSVIKGVLSVDATRERLLASARSEFLEHGYRGASLRRIAAGAGVTTGAIYGCFGGKSELFDALVGEAYGEFMGNFIAAQEAFSSLPPERQPDFVGVCSRDYIEWAVEYMLDHRDEFRLILQCSEGTRYAGLIDEMAAIETRATDDFLAVLDGMSHKRGNVSPMLEHIMVSAMFSGFMEIVLHDMTLPEAREYARQLREFFTAGWLKIMEL